MAASINGVKTLSAASVDVEVYEADARGCCVDIEVMALTSSDIVSVKVYGKSLSVPQGWNTIFVERNIELFASPNNKLILGAFPLAPGEKILVSSQNGAQVTINGVSGEV